MGYHHHGALEATGRSVLGSGNLESTDGLHAVDELLLAPPERCVDVAPVLATGYEVGGFGYNRGLTI